MARIIYYIFKNHVAPLIILSIALSFLALPSRALATLTVSHSPDPVYQDSGSMSLTVNSDTDFFDVGDTYTFGRWKEGCNQTVVDFCTSFTSVIADDPRRLIAEWRYFPSGGGNIEYKYKIWKGTPGDLTDNNMILPLGTTEGFAGSYIMYPAVGAAKLGIPAMEMDNNVFKDNTNATLRIVNVDPEVNYALWFNGQATALNNTRYNTNLTTNTRGQKVATTSIPVGDTGNKILCLRVGQMPLNLTAGFTCDFKLEFRVISTPPQGDPTPISSGIAGAPDSMKCDPELQDDPVQTCPYGTVCRIKVDAVGADTWVCRSDSYTENSSSNSLTCAKGKDKNGNITTIPSDIVSCQFIDTAIGQISTDPATFVKYIYSVVLGLAGGIALILIILAGYKFMTSQGNPEKVKSASEGLTSAIIGLLFIIFAFVILQIIGVDILRIPGFK